MRRPGRRIAAWNWSTAVSHAGRVRVAALPMAVHPGRLGRLRDDAAEEDPVQIKLNDLDTRVARIERVVANKSLLELANQVEALRTDVRAMHNDVDVLNHARVEPQAAARSVRRSRSAVEGARGARRRRRCSCRGCRRGGPGAAAGPPVGQRRPIRRYQAAFGF
jgi:hypothetical protein